jgi:sortase A
MTRGSRVPARLLCVALLVLGALDIGRAAYMPAKAHLAQILLDRAFKASLATGELRRPWPWADTRPLARLTFERLHTRQIVLAGGSGQAMAFGPAHLPRSAPPAHAGTTIISAHRDSHFSVLRKVEKGDLITVENVDGATARYRVVRSAVVRADHFGIERDAPSRLVLTTCYPFGARTSSSWRYIVIAQPDESTGPPPAST